MERMMKAQEVILKAAAGKLKWWEAAEIMGVTDRTMRRWRERLNEHGYSGLWDYRKRRPSPKRVPMKTVEEVLQLYREKYFDFNVQHFHEKLRELHDIELSYSWVKTALQTAGLVKRRKKPGSHRKRRPRRALPGMMLHIDGSEHRWFGDERCYELIVVLDDATSEIYYAQLVEAESTRTVMVALREVVVTRGLFCSLYSDRAGHFLVMPKHGARVEMSRPTRGGAGLGGTRGEDDRGVFTAGEGAIGAQFRNLAGWSAAGTESARDLGSSASQRVPRSRICSGVQPARYGACRREGQRVCACPAQRSGLDFQS